MRSQPSSPVTLDATDRAIVAALVADGRLSMRALAERLHISRLSGENLRRQQVKERVERCGLVRQHLFDRSERAAAQTLPNELQSDGPALRCLMQPLGLVVGQFVAGP